MRNRPELLAPVQDWNTLQEINGLADAIYFGVQKYNMRANARNFEREELTEIVKYCHSQRRPIKAYLTTNILIYDSELQDVERLLIEAKKAKIDAIIAHDLGVLRFARRFKMPYHISTQANISNVESAKFFEQLGAKRINLARELSLTQIKLIKHHLIKTEIETFIHGSMCTSVSGRCYFSATITDSEEFSANRGNCSQPCRRAWRVIDDENNEFIYDGELFLNARDLCMIEYIPQLIEANIDAFKIEGRMKDPRYVRTVLECYGEAINSYYKGDYTKEKLDDWIERLSSVFNRGFHTGFYFKKPGPEDIELERRGSVSPYKKHYLGKILSFDRNSMTANILIEIRDFNLKIGDEILIVGKNTYHHQQIRHMVYKGEKIKTIQKTRFESPFKINMTINKEVRENDKIYILYKTQN